MPCNPLVLRKLEAFRRWLAWDTADKAHALESPIERYRGLALRGQPGPACPRGDDALCGALSASAARQARAPA